MNDSQGDSKGFLREIINHGSILLFGRITQLGIKFAATIILARYLGRTGFGAISLALSVFMIGSTLSMAGLNSGVARFLPRYETSEEKGKIVSSAGKIVILLSVCVGVAIYSGTFVLELGFRKADLEVIRVLTVAIPLFAGTKLIWGIFQGEKLSQNFMMTKQIFLPLVRLSLLTGAVVAGLGLLGLAYAQIGTYAIITVIAVYYLFRDRRKLIVESISWDLSKSSELLAFSSPLILAGAMNIVLSQTDTILIGMLATTAEVGVYNAIYPLAMLMFVVQSSLAFIFLPSISEKQAGADGIDEEARESYLHAVRMIAVLTFPAYFLFIYQPDIVLGIIFGSGYRVGAFALIVLSIGFYTRAILGPDNPALKALGKTNSIMIIDTISALVNVVLNIVFIQQYGIVGAAIATGISYLLMGIGYNYALFKYARIHPVSKRTVSVAILSVLLPLVVRIGTNTVGLSESIGMVFFVTVATGCLYALLLSIFRLVDFRMIAQELANEL